jgi:hypothetical protein
MVHGPPERMSLVWSQNGRRPQSIEPMVENLTITACVVDHS